MSSDKDKEKEKEKKEEEDEKDNEESEGTKKEVEVDDSTPLLLVEKAATWLSNPRLTDVVFKVGKDAKQLSAHRFVLAMASPTFESFLYPLSISKDDKLNFSTTLDAAVEITLKDEDPDNFALLLKCIYTDKAEVTTDNFKALVILAEKYQVEKLAMLCADFLAGDLTPDNACELFEMTTAMHADSQGIRDYICENAESIFEGENYIKLSEASIKSLLADDALAIDELPLFNAIVKWGEAKMKETGEKELKTVLKDISTLIRFPLLSIQELMSSVTKTSLIDQTGLLLLCSYAGITDESARKKMKMTWPTKPREGGFLSKESKLLDRKYKKELARLFEGKKVKLALVYRGSRDGYDNYTFHAKADNKGATLVVIKSGSGQYISGGYNPQSWSGSGNYVASGCWLFTLDNPSHTPLKMMQTNSNGAYCYSSYGPTWGGGHDLHISSSMQSTSNYSSPSSFNQIATGYSGSFSNSTLFGSYNFVVEEIECFTVTEKSK